MRVIIGGVYQPVLEGSTVQINRSMSDPVPTCSLSIKDNTSSFFVHGMQELLILDDQIIPNPTVNFLLNPSLNPYTTSWAVTNAGTGRSYAQISGGGIAVTFTNFNGFPFSTILTTGVSSIRNGTIIAGQMYTASVFVQGSSSPTNLQASLTLQWLDVTQSVISSVVFTGPNPVSTTLTRYSVSGTAPTNAVSAWIQLSVTPTNSTNSGVVSFTQAQLEPNWMPTLSYPTPWCGPSQANCVQLPLGNWIRQYRRFAGFINHATYGDYYGNVRTVQVDAVGYAWLLSLIMCNNTYTNKTDAFILTDLLNTYLTSNGTAMVNTTNIIVGATLSSIQSNWDDLRAMADNLAAQSGSYWTIDYYWNAIFAPPGYYSMMIALIADNSSNPDMATTFPAYNFSAEMDYTQPGSSVLVLGNGANTAQVIDGSVASINALASGYNLPPSSSYMRKVNESALNSVADCTQRGIAEILQYDYERYIYHLSTNVELVPGYGIQITSNTDNLNKSTQLIQQTKAQWLGTSETLNDTWEYQSDLGATNRTATHILSRLFRIANSNSSAPAIATTTLTLIERLGIMEQPSTGTIATTYQATVLGNSPIAYYRLGEFEGTVADDYSGSGFGGTLNGTVTLNQAGALLKDSDGAMKLDGTTGYIALPAGLSTSGWTAFSFECWVNLTSTPTVGNPRILDNSKTDVDFHGFEVIVNRLSGLTISFALGTGTAANIITSVSGLTIGTYAYIAGTFDGVNMRLFFNGVRQAMTAFTSFAINASTNPVNIGRNVTGADNFLPATIDEPALYHATLSRYQIQQNYAVATSPYAVAVRADGPAAYYRLDELTGTAVYDWSGNSNDGTINGTVTLNQAGALTGSNDNDPSMLFNGTTGYVALTGITLNGAAAFSMECWIRIPTTYSNFPRILASDDAQNNLKGFDFGVNPPGTGGAFFNVALNGVWKQVSCSTMFSMSTWYHLAVTYDGATLTMYVNGVSVGTTAATGTITSTTNAIHIGNLNTTFWPGDLDEVALSTVTLTASQIMNHYTKGTTH